MLRKGFVNSPVEKRDRSRSYLILNSADRNQDNTGRFCNTLAWVERQCAVGLISDGALAYQAYMIRSYAAPTGVEVIRASSSSAIPHSGRNCLAPFR